MYHLRDLSLGSLSKNEQQFLFRVFDVLREELSEEQGIELKRIKAPRTRSRLVKLYRASRKEK